MSVAVHVLSVRPPERKLKGTALCIHARVEARGKPYGDQKVVRRGAATEERHRVLREQPLPRVDLPDVQLGPPPGRVHAEVHHALGLGIDAWVGAVRGVPGRVKLKFSVEDVNASVCNFSFLRVNMSRYTEYYRDIRRRTRGPSV